MIKEDRRGRPQGVEDLGAVGAGDCPALNASVAILPAVQSALLGTVRDVVAKECGVKKVFEQLRLAKPVTIVDCARDDGSMPPGAGP
ncbi:hypothetical protein [Saccharopolyspora pogona]|uniref:hypothetical protein n=1 Tax=Saccharopolyspora pogona TaxID=333966 RepID=UPI0016883272|nr:hypothetical protein [Saccharopolyspora pogona]